MRVLVYNIHHGVGCDGHLNLERIARVIEETEADIVGLNEVDVHFHRRSSFVNQLAWLKDRLGMHGVFGPAIAIRDPFRPDLRQYGNGLLSKSPFLHFQNLYFPGRMSDESRGMLIVEFQYQGRQFQVVVTHMGLTPWMRSRQLRTLLKLCCDKEMPRVVMGDWNVLPDRPEVRRLSPYLLDVMAGSSSNRHHTYPCTSPRKRIDYIFCSSHFRVYDAHIVDTPDCPSDHLPVFCHLAWAER